MKVQGGSLSKRLAPFPGRPACGARSGLKPVYASGSCSTSPNLQSAPRKVLRWRASHAGAHRRRHAFPARAGLDQTRRGLLQTRGGLLQTWPGLFPARAGRDPTCRGFLPARAGLVPARGGGVQTSAGLLPTWRGLEQTSPGLDQTSPGRGRENEGPEERWPCYSGSRHLPSPSPLLWLQTVADVSRFLLRVR